ncbi:oxidoreductase [Subtercola boreus]|uniref:Oxidoreductase n=1 Tax=Subtercola boreus TaxID=120213 RepID=A0A3E0VT57_9MICO|nr:FAD-binding oxidoreductase [Subtercola boreus]RFA12911.1 oxidoreductase [Subtercola boreus]
MLDVVRPGDAAYRRLQHVYSGTGTPHAILLPTDANGVIDALAFAGAVGGALSVRSGGHGISSIATNAGGTVIDLGRLNDVERIGDSTVRIGPGARWGQVAEKLQPWGLAISSGDSGDVGVGGLATTGGIGLMGRAHGLTIDRLTSVQMITADGQFHDASEKHNSDLFWAVRGAGANVGIVTSFTFEASTTPLVARATMAYQLKYPAVFLTEWGDALERAPREISAFLYIGAGDAPFAQALIVYAGAEVEAAAAALKPFAELPGIIGQNARVVPYAHVPQTSNTPHNGQQTAFTHTGLADHLNAELSHAVAGLLSDKSTLMVQIRSVGGMINDIPTDATAYAHRHQNFSITAMAAAESASFEEAWMPVRSRMSGLYLSFESSHDPAYIREAFPTPTLERLRTIKSFWDPEDRFNQNFDVTRALV